MKISAKKAWPFVLIVFLIVLYFYPLIFLNRIFFFSDLARISYPLKQWSARNVAEGNLPIWIDNIFCGYPLIAKGETGFFCPFNFVLYLAFEESWAFRLHFIVLFLAGFLFTYRFGRYISLERLPAALSAIVATFGAVWICRIVHPNYLGVIIFVPLGLLFLEKGLRKKPSYFLFASLVITWQVLAGCFPFLFLSLYIYTAYLLLRTAFNDGIRIKKLTKCLILMSLIIVLGLGMGAVQLLPTRELSEYSVRSEGLDFQTATFISFHPRNLILYVFPNFFGWSNPFQNIDFWMPGGNYHEQASYVGILPLILAMFSLSMIKRNQYVKTFWAIFLLSLLLAMGKYSPLFRIMWIFPPARYFRMPIRFNLISSFCLAVLSGFGLSQVLDKGKRTSDKFKRRFVKICWIFLVSILLISITGTIVTSIGRDCIYNWSMRIGTPLVERYVYQSPGREKSLEEYLQILDNFVSETISLIHKTINPVSQYNFPQLIILCLSCFLMHLFLRSKIPPRLLGLSALFLVLTDLGHFGLTYNPTFPINEVLPKPLTVRFLEKDETQFRIYADGNNLGRDNIELCRETLPPNLNALWDIDSANGFCPLASVRYIELHQIIANQLKTEQFRQGGLKLLGMMNVKYIVSPVETIRKLDLEIVHQEKGVAIGVNQYCLPRVYLVGDVLQLTHREVLERLEIGEIDFAKTVLIEDYEDTIYSNRICSGTAIIDKWENTEKVIQASNDGHCILVTSIPYYPGWRVTVNGERQKIYRANNLFISLPLNPGTHRIEFRFKPVSLIIGAIVSVVSLIVFSIVMVRIRNIRRH